MPEDKPTKKVIALTADFPDLNKMTEGEAHAYLHNHGVVFDDDGFVSYADLNAEQTRALANAHRDEMDAALRVWNATMKKRSPEQRKIAFTSMPPEARAAIIAAMERMRDEGSL